MSAAAASAEPAEVQAAQQEWPSTPHADAERMVEKAQTRNMTVKFMLDKLKEVCTTPILPFNDTTAALSLLQRTLP